MIYFLEALNANLLKIGFTDRPIKDRVREIQTSCPHPLYLAATMDGTREDEANLHRRFAHLRCNGEWFAYESELRAVVACISLFAQEITYLARATQPVDVVGNDDTDVRPRYAWEVAEECLERIQAIEASLREYHLLPRKEVI